MHRNVIVTIADGGQVIVGAGGYDLDSGQDVKRCLEALRLGQQALAELLIDLEVSRRIEAERQAGEGDSGE